jgi:hypothetical protein
VTGVRARPQTAGSARLVATLALAAAFLAVGCGSTDDPSPSGPATSSGPASVAPSSSPTPAPSVDLHGAPELEGRLPTSIGGTVLTSVSLAGDEFLLTGGEAGRGQVEAMLESLGKTAADLSVAQAADPTGVLVFQQGLFRVAGADPAQLLAEWVGAQQAATSNRLQVSDAEVDGHPTTHLVDPSRADGASTYVVADGDTLVIVLAIDEALVAEALSAI